MNKIPKSQQKTGLPHTGAKKFEVYYLFKILLTKNWHSVTFLI